jgi:hypothetical protein
MAGYAHDSMVSGRDFGFPNFNEMFHGAYHRKSLSVDNFLEAVSAMIIWISLLYHV